MSAKPTAALCLLDSPRKLELHISSQFSKMSQGQNSLSHDLAGTVFCMSATPNLHSLLTSGLSSDDIGQFLYGSGELSAM